MPSFTSKHQRKPDLARNRALDLKRNRAAVLKKEPPNEAVTATLSTLNSKSWTKTRKNNGNNLLTTAARSTVAGSTQKQKEKNKRLWQQLT